MLNIPLVEGWSLKSDVNNYILVEQRNGRDVNSWFFSTIDNALNCFLERKIRQFDSTSLSELLEAVKQLHTALSKSLAPLHLKVEPINQ